GGRLRLVEDRDLPSAGARVGEVDVEQHLVAEIVIGNQRGFRSVLGGRAVGGRQRTGGRGRACWQVAGKVALRAGRRRHLLIGDLHRHQTLEAVRGGGRIAIGVAVGHQLVAGSIDQPALGIWYESAGAGEVGGAARVLDDEEAVAVDGEIRYRSGGLQNALRADGGMDRRRDAARIVGAAGGRHYQRREFGGGTLVA